MTKTARVYKIELLIRSRGHVSFDTLRQTLEVSPATLKRDLDYLRDQLGAPIVYDRALNGYRFDAVAPAGPRHELPGLWFDERELYALLTAHQLLSEIDADGALSRHLGPLLDRIHHMLGAVGADADPRLLLNRIKLIGTARRPVPSRWFELVTEALLKRRRVHLRYLTRGRRAHSERDLSPQRLVHYRGTWYVDAWCHARDKLLRFALDAIEQAEALPTEAVDLPLERVAAEMDGGYGIYAGAAAEWATLVFTPRAAQWVSMEQWHPQQRASWLPNGHYQLAVPYADPNELAMDVLRHADDVTIENDTGTLRDTVRERIERAWAKYRTTATAG